MLRSVCLSVSCPYLKMAHFMAMISTNHYQEIPCWKSTIGWSIHWLIVSAVELQVCLINLLTYWSQWPPEVAETGGAIRSIRCEFGLDMRVELCNRRRRMCEAALSTGARVSRRTGQLSSVGGGLRPASRRASLD